MEHHAFSAHVSAHGCLFSCINLSANCHSETGWKMALDTGANVLALNIVEAAARSESLIQRRRQLNALIANHHEKERW